MEDISLNAAPKKKDNSGVDGELSMSVSPVFEKGGQKKACVSFSDKSRVAEGEIPECKIIKNQGFSEEEVEALERYMKANLTMLKKMASSVNVLGAFMK